MVVLGSHFGGVSGPGSSAAMEAVECGDTNICYFGRFQLEIRKLVLQNEANRL